MKIGEHLEVEQSSADKKIKKKVKAADYHEDPGTSSQGRAIGAGGPGSGRHPGYGKFSRVNSPANDKTLTERWHHKGTKTDVHITDTTNKKFETKTAVKENGKVVHKGDQASASTFVKNRYGINDNA